MALPLLLPYSTVPCLWRHWVCGRLGVSRDSECLTVGVWAVELGNQDAEWSADVVYRAGRVP
jgi:hypothetical protein